MIYINQINSYRVVVAICDEELLGKYFEEEKLQLDVKERFYKGDLVSEKEAVEIISNLAKEDATFNIVGEKSILAAIKSGAITEESIRKVNGIPFTLALL